jgi:hypothetical protein
MYGTMTVLCLGTCFNSLEAFHTLLWNIWTMNVFLHHDIKAHFCSINV